MNCLSSLRASSIFRRPFLALFSSMVEPPFLCFESLRLSQKAIEGNQIDDM
jgi:hypothetical protein